MRLLLLLILLPSLAFAQNDCFEKAYDQSFLAPATDLRVKRIRGLKGCSSMDCLLKATPRRKNILFVYRSRGMRPQAIFGNGGWDKSVAVVRTRKSVQVAKALAEGVELSSLYSGDQTLINGDRDFHDRFAWENRCLRRGGESVLSFNEIAYIPRKAPPIAN